MAKGKSIVKYPLKTKLDAHVVPDVFRELNLNFYIEINIKRSDSKGVKVIKRRQQPTHCGPIHEPKRHYNRTVWRSKFLKKVPRDDDNLFSIIKLGLRLFPNLMCFLYIKQNSKTCFERVDAVCFFFT